MRLSKYIFTIITKYLKREESLAERIELYEWYDSLENQDQLIPKQNLKKLRNKGKHRLFDVIGKEQPKKYLTESTWFRIAAIIVVILSYLSYRHFESKKKDLKPVSTVQLEKLVQPTGGTTISFSTGEVISLDSLDNQKSTAIGDINVIKGRDQELTFGSNTSSERKNVIGTLQTAKASQCQIVLSDGTKVWLNAESKLSFPENFGPGDRTVELTGEAYFDVKKTSEKSHFFVKSNGQSIEVLGTRFNINGYVRNATIKTTLAEGTLKVKPMNKALGNIILKPNQQAVLSDHGLINIHVDASKIIAWKDGYFSFDGNNTTEILKEIGEWYGIPIEFKSSGKNVRYTGKIPKKISLSKLIILLSYQGINVKAFKDNNDNIKLIVT